MGMQSINPEEERACMSTEQWKDGHNGRKFSRGSNGKTLNTRISTRISRVTHICYLILKLILSSVEKQHCEFTLL